MSKSPLGSHNLDDPVDDETRFRNGWSTGIRLTLNQPGYYAHELGFPHTRVGIETSIPQGDGTTMNPVESRANIEETFYSFMLYMMPMGERWRPYNLAFTDIELEGRLIRRQEASFGLGFGI